MFTDEQEACYSFLTKSAKLKLMDSVPVTMNCYSFLTKSAKLKRGAVNRQWIIGYSFLTKSAKLKPKNAPPL